MDAQQLRERQAPLKEKYRNDPEAALVTLDAQSGLDADGIACSIEVGGKLEAAGLYPATGGSGVELCSCKICWRRWRRARASPCGR